MEFIVKSYHRKQAFCYKRPDYREARWGRAIKVYTVNQESKYLLVQGVPTVGASKELIELFALYGDIEEYRLLDEYPTEEFTEVYWIKYKQIQSARFGKRKLDNRSFFGGQLHVCYAPEYESVEDTRQKLYERRRYIARKCKEYFGGVEETSTITSTTTVVNKVKHQSRACGDNEAPSQLDNEAPSKRDNEAQQYLYPSLPTPPINIPYHLIPPPPAIDTTLPRIPTKQATLPKEIQQLSVEQVYQGYCSERIVNKNEEQTLLGQTQNKCGLEIQDNDPNDLPNNFVQQRKRINWNKPHLCKIPPDQNDLRAYSYTKEPGAWDPFKNERHVNSPAQSEEIDSTVLQIRGKLQKTVEPASTLQEQETICPLQTTVKQQPIPKRRKQDGRKRI